MLERKIVLALQKLDKTEILNFKTFIYSPYFNVNQEIINLFEIVLPVLLKRNVKVDRSDLEVWSTLYPNLNFDPKKFNRLFFMMGNLFDRFISQKEYEELILFKNKLLGEEILKIPNKSLQKKILKQSNEFLESKNNFSSQYALFKYFTLKQEHQNFPLIHQMEWLNVYFILEKLNAYVTLLSWKKMYKLDVGIHFMEFVFKLTGGNHYNEYPSILVFNKITDMLTNVEDTSHYFSLRSQMKQYVGKFSEPMQREMYTTALSYCIEKVNQSRIDFNREVFDLFEESVENNIIQENNEITVSVFRNIVVAALRVGEFEWTEKFIEENKKFVNPKFRDNAVYFSLARLEINRENYNKVLDYLQLINYDDVWYQLGSKTMQMAAYYGLGEHDALESFFSAFKMYVNREKSLTKERKMAYGNLIKYTKKIIYLVPHEKSKIEKLKQEIEASNAIVNKSWLLERVEELKTKR